MTDSHAKPLTIFALLQVAIILLGIMASGIFSKMFRDSFHGEPPALLSFILNWGFILLAIPIVWLFVTLQVRNSETPPRVIGTVLYLLGIVLVVGLAFLMLSVSVVSVCGSGPM